ncbi:DUF4426 domain-containing protein [Candidatus Marithioploca araucensis]|uniref:DUF4426 domain-containing protein n=1 Tax=Candidatus Marithioploca araucensis TaxID=70273 RepID=A0ABT7VSP1_9GAMM|nr:DUF4426 domain-containing protein [Candidatus Marithioploca araucensis]
MFVKKTLYSILAISLLALTSHAMAEKSVKTNDGYVIHYNTVNTSFLTPENARIYQIKRSKNRAMLLISVRKGDSEKPKQTQAVKAKVMVQAMNLSEQEKGLDMREVVEGSADTKAIYYVDDFSISNEEMIKFIIQVDSENRGKVHEFDFSQQFFVDK